MKRERWSFALAVTGELHVWPHSMPAASNLVTVGVLRDGDMLRIAPADVDALRRLLDSDGYVGRAERT
jgi:hypothetical protein